MSVGKTLNTNVTQLGVLAMTIVIISVVVVKFADVDGVTSEINETINTFVTAFQEPASWVSIIIVALVGWFLVRMFSKGKNM
jgi:hypothetical protein